MPNSSGKRLGTSGHRFLLQRDQKGDALTAARAYVDPDKGVETPEDALAGARDIVAELAAEDPTLRQTLREQLWNTVSSRPNWWKRRKRPRPS